MRTGRDVLIVGQAAQSQIYRKQGESVSERVLIVGDVHGRIRRFGEIIDRQKPEHLIQVGDFGFRREHNWFLEHLAAETSHIVFGNHDYMPYLNKPHSLGDWSCPFPGVMTMRGADSIDRRYRTPGVNWWHNEEMSYVRMQECIEAYGKICPDIVITHECPQIVRRKTFGIPETSRTSTGLQHCLDQHAPRLWIFGHHHASVTRVFGNTRFVGLNELETCWLDTDSE